MNILITNIWLVNHGGTEVGVRDLAIALHKRGVHVEVYSPELGAVADEIRTAGIHITDSTRDLIMKPDLIHAQHFIPSMDAIVRFPDVPAIYFLHDRTHPADNPPKYSQIVKYFAVDYNCLDRLIIDNGIDENDTGVLFNWVDLNRFRLREKISEIPARALVFSNYATKENYFKVLKEACSRQGIELEGIGVGFGNPVNDPENILNKYDIVFAKAKAAMEAMATGAGVILCDTRGLGEFVNRENFKHFRKFNFGMKTLTRPIEVDLVIQEIEKYRKDEILVAANLIRNDASFDIYLDKILEVYKAAIKEYHHRQSGHENNNDILTVQKYLSEKAALFQNTWINYKALQESFQKISTSVIEKEKIILDQNELIRRSGREIMQLKNSWSFRIGKILTAPARSIYQLYKKSV